jgi:hypothetical protein
MSNRRLNFDDALYDYFHRHTLREPDLLTRLRADLDVHAADRRWSHARPQAAIVPPKVFLLKIKELNHYKYWQFLRNCRQLLL